MERVESAYHKIWSELSAKDQDVVLAIHQSENGEIIRIRQILNWTNNQLNPYRDRLIRAGVANSPQNGILSLSLPWFGEFAEEMHMLISNREELRETRPD